MSSSSIDWEWAQASIMSLEKKLIQTLHEFKEDVFAYSASGMQGLDASFACHELNIKEGFQPIKQKRRHLGHERNAHKSYETVRTRWVLTSLIWISLTLKIINPEDWQIGSLDSTVGHELLSFMDANASYHQIPMAENTYNFRNSLRGILLWNDVFHAEQCRRNISIKSQRATWEEHKGLRRWHDCKK